MYPDFTVAVLDTAVDLLHEDLDFNIVRDISDENGNFIRYPHTSWYPNHGNAVIGLFSAGKIGNGLGGRGIVNAKKLFLSANSTSDILDNQGNHFSIGYNANTVLEGITRLVNPITKVPDDGFQSPKIVSLSVGVSPKTELATKGQNFNQGAHFKATQPIRDYIEQNAGVLFVMLAHNQSTDAKKSNGALHYKYIGDPNNEQELLDENNYVFQKLPNLIIVAANGPDGILHGYSNYGESVDITGPSGVYAASCVQNYAQSTYHSVINNQLYGFDYNYFDYSTQRDKSGDNEDDASFHLSCYENGYFNGTSTSQPIVAGAAAILLANHENLTATEIKHYLTETPDLIKASLRYSTEANSYAGYAYFCQGTPYEDSCNIRTPVLNIEKSMKQYEIDHTIVEDFENFLNFENSSEFINIYSNYNYQNNNFYVITSDTSQNIYFMGNNYPGNPFNSNAIGVKISSGVRFGNGNITKLSFDVTTTGDNANVNIEDTNGNVLDSIVLSSNVITHVNLILSKKSYVYIKGISGDLNGIVLIDNMNVETAPFSNRCLNLNYAQSYPESCIYETFIVNNTNFFGKFDDYTISNGPGNYLYNGVIYKGNYSLSFMSTGKLNQLNKCGSRCARVYLDNATIIFPENIKKLSFSTVVQSPLSQNYGDSVFQLIDQNGNSLGSYTTNCSGLTKHQINIPANLQVKSIFFKRISGPNYINLDNMSYNY